MFVLHSGVFFLNPLRLEQFFVKVKIISLMHSLEHKYSAECFSKCFHRILWNSYQNVLSGANKDCSPAL